LDPVEVRLDLDYERRADSGEQPSLEMQSKDEKRRTKDITTYENQRCIQIICVFALKFLVKLVRQSLVCCPEFSLSVSRKRLLCRGFKCRVHSDQ
jgi:hypothetical protein